MRKINSYLLSWLVLSILLVNCTKKDIATFASDDAVNFGRIENTNTVTYSFMANPNDEYIQEVPVLIMGDTAGFDRSFEVQVVNDSNTTASPDQYQILGGTVKAGQFTGTLAVKLMKTPDLDDTTVSLKLKLIDAADFKAGNIESSEFIVRWTNKVVVPSWTYFRYFFTSVPSTAAYRLIVQTTGLTTLTARQYAVDIGAAGVQALATKFGDYVKQWNKDHPNDKLKHDDGPKAGEEIVPLYYTHSKYD